jgi:N-6 DNA Methylase
MKTLHKDLRRQLETTVIEARRVAETGARQALEQLAVHHHEPWKTQTPEQRGLRRRLRAHGRQLGDRLTEDGKGRQDITHLVQECAYEHWHRMLFARFLAENHLLIDPTAGVPVTLDECRELARERGSDWLTLASEYAVRMLPQIFRQHDPVLGVSLPPEARQSLEELLQALAPAIFSADDSLGWVYQFWQTERKNDVNASEKRIGADEIGPVTQLFTEDYIVLFLLHNTLGAWWAGKVLAATPGLARGADSEDDVRSACKVGDVEWTYLRFVRDEDGAWRPAAGTFKGWPDRARDVKVLDPSMGSGHFLTFLLPLLTAIRAQEERLSSAQAAAAVIRDNLFGLEIDNRCTQIAAFNLALTAWKLVGYQALPVMHLACSGLAPNTTEQDWVSLAGRVDRVRSGMQVLYRLFKNAPILGSLVNPKLGGGDLLQAAFTELAPLLERAMAGEREDDDAQERAVTALGVAEAAAILAGAFTLVSTNVPYLGRGKQDDVLREYCERFHPNGKADLATCFVERCLDLCAEGGTAALVTPQSWLFLGTYKALRKDQLTTKTWNLVARLGPGAFETISGEVVNVALLALTRERPGDLVRISGLDVSGLDGVAAKADELRRGPIKRPLQSAVRANPDSIVTFDPIDSSQLLGRYAQCFQGTSTGDNPRFTRHFWELPSISGGWRTFQTSPEATGEYAGRSLVVQWDVVERGFAGAAVRGLEAWGKRGVAIGQMANLPATLYDGDLFSNATPVIIPMDQALLPAIWCFCSSGMFSEEMRKLNPKLSVDNGYVSKVPIDLDYWRNIAHSKYPSGLPTPSGRQPTQWVFCGRPQDSDQILQVAVARVLGYRWPRQSNGDGLDEFVDADGILCLDAIAQQEGAARRLRRLLAQLKGGSWSGQDEGEMLRVASAKSRSLDEWLRDEFFEQHCSLFDQAPFVWHMWDGRKDGFHALLNYHRLVAPGGEGRRALEKVIYTYLGEWIDRQRADQQSRVEGADGRLAAAEHLKKELERILEGEPPYDIFARWKPLHEQPIGWEPDVNDGLRVNIRPFMTARPLDSRGKSACILRVRPKGIDWSKDRGKEPERSKDDWPWFWGWDEQADDFMGGPRFDGNRWNDLHYSRTAKEAARARRGGQ